MFGAALFKTGEKNQCQSRRETIMPQSTQSLILWALKYLRKFIMFREKHKAIVSFRHWNENHLPMENHNSEKLRRNCSWKNKWKEIHSNVSDHFSEN